MKHEPTHYQYHGATLKKGALIAILSGLYLKDYLNKVIYESILLDDKHTLKPLELSKTFISITFVGTKAVACVMLIPNKKVGTLVSVFVKQGYRRMGIGSSLLEFAKDLSGKKNFYQDTSRPSGQKFYSKFDWIR